MHARFFSHFRGTYALICTNHIISSIDEIMNKQPYTGVMLLGDFNNLNDILPRSYPLLSECTRRSVILDKIFTNIHSLYNLPKFLPPSKFLVTMSSIMSQPSHLDIT